MPGAYFLFLPFIPQPSPRFYAIAGVPKKLPPALTHPSPLLRVRAEGFTA